MNGNSEGFVTEILVKLDYKISKYDILSANKNKEFTFYMVLLSK